MKIKLDTKKIFLAMAERGIDGTELANEIGVSQQAVSSVLNGKRLGKNKIIPGICRVLNLKAKDIVIIED